MTQFQNQSELLPILKKYFKNPVNAGFEIKKLSGGMLNETYKIRVNKKPYILQKISNIFDKTVVEDMVKATNFLNEHDISAPNLIETLNGKYFVQNDSGDIFRIYNYIYGETPDKFSMSNNNMKTLGIYLASVHKELEHLNYEPQHKIENFHVTQFYIDKVKKILDKFESEDKELIQAMIGVYENLDKSFLQNEQIIHGDPRIENIIFDKKLNQYSLIDFDTVMKASVYIDIGDICRSLFIDGELENISYKRILHEKFLIGYYLEMTKNQPKTERISKEQFIKNSINATLLISLELAIRFFIDVIEDNYFGYDKENFSSRKEHNLFRAQNCYELFRIIHKDNFKE